MSDDLLAESWTLTCGGVTNSAAGWGVTDLVRRRVSQGTDVCRVHVDGAAIEATPIFAHGSTVTVARNGTTWFAGRVTGVPASGDGDAEGQVYRLSGPWWFLEQLVARQQWSLRGGVGSAWTTRLILGQSANGSRLTTGGVISQTLQDAIAAGAPLQAGVIDPALSPPLDEVRELTCAQVVQAMLRWHPDCAAWFDYSTSNVPTWHCRQRANLPAVTLTVGSAPLAAVRGITARHDLAVPSVVLNYEVNVAGEGGATWLDVVTDAAPAGATGREFGAVVGTIPLGAAAAVPDAAAAVGAALLALAPVGAHAGGGSGAGATGSVAAGFLAALSALPYSGSVVLVEGAGELGATGAGLGSVLNLAGSGAAEWAGMRALVVEEEVRVATGTTTLRFGPEMGVGREGLSAALRVTRAGVVGRETGSPGLSGTRMSTARVSGKVAG